MHFFISVLELFSQTKIILNLRSQIFSCTYTSVIVMGPFYFCFWDLFSNKNNFQPEKSHLITTYISVMPFSISVLELFSKTKINFNLMNHILSHLYISVMPFFISVLEIFSQTKIIFHLRSHIWSHTYTSVMPLFISVLDSFHSRPLW